MARHVFRTTGSGSLPLYAQAERALRQMVVAAQPGDLLPPETDLAEQLGVSRTTIRQAMQRLVSAGLITRTPGRGTEVVDRHIDSQLDFTPFVRALQASGHDVCTAEADVQHRAADEEEAAALGLEPGTAVRELRRLRLVDDVPFALLRTVLAPRVPLPDDLDSSLYEFLEGAGIHLVRIDDALSAVGANREVAAALGVPRRAPVLMVRRVSYDATGEPVECAHTYLRQGAGYTVQHKR